MLPSTTGNQNILRHREAASLLGVSVATLYRVAKRFPIRHPYHRGWYLKDRVQKYQRGELRPS